MLCKYPLASLHGEVGAFWLGYPRHVQMTTLVRIATSYKAHNKLCTQGRCESGEIVMSVPEIIKVCEIKRRGQNSLQCVNLQTRKPREPTFCCRCCLRKGFMCFPPGHSPPLGEFLRTNQFCWHMKFEFSVPLTYSWYILVKIKYIFIELTLTLETSCM